LKLVAVEHLQLRSALVVRLLLKVQAHLFLLLLQPQAAVQVLD
jgi:hypothetical protein